MTSVLVEQFSARGAAALPLLNDHATNTFTSRRLGATMTDPTDVGQSQLPAGDFSKWIIEIQGALRARSRI